MSDPTPFDIHAFDPERLDVPALLEGIAAHLGQSGATTVANNWTLTTISAGEKRTILSAMPDDPAVLPVVAIKLRHGGDSGDVSREYAVLSALWDFGLRIAPRPFYASETPPALDAPILISEWIPGAPLGQPPAVNEEDRWHRIMALLGVANNLPFAKYANTIPLKGSGAQAPSDIIAGLKAELRTLSTAHPAYEALTGLTTRVEVQVAPQWNMAPPFTLNHLDPQPHHFIWDGHHLRLVGWDQADWTDTAYAVGQLCAHPAYEEVPGSHWVWYRWELARLTKDEYLIPRATTYTNLLRAWWAVKLHIEAAHIEDAKRHKRLAAQAERYRKAAERAFPD
ncbi:MAG: phosphotransferase [Chloroflexi bacterium]|nr:phosphotransferase [Chloroflexota bacterium]